MTAYYNEIDHFAAQWLRNLIDAGHIAPGIVDERSIEDVTPQDLQGFTQCHFFAGIGVWSYALRQAGWPDNRPAWTGSCPCQPFSAAGKGEGFADERHLWPAFFHLIQQCQPTTIFGEQVASKDGLGWLDLVQTDLEGSDYSATAVDLCAAGVGAPHIRQRLYWVADTDNTRLERYRGLGQKPLSKGREGAQRYIGASGMVGGLEYPNDQLKAATGNGQRITDIGGASSLVWMADTNNQQRSVAMSAGSSGLVSEQRNENSTPIAGCRGDLRPGPVNGFWGAADWLRCRDEKWRAVEPRTCPLADGVAGRVGRLRAYGNAINAEVAKAFIEAYMYSDAC